MANHIKIRITDSGELMDPETFATVPYKRLLGLTVVDYIENEKTIVFEEPYFK